MLEGTSQKSNDHLSLHAQYPLPFFNDSLFLCSKLHTFIQAHQDTSSVFKMWPKPQRNQSNLSCNYKKNCPAGFEDASDKRDKVLFN